MQSRAHTAYTLRSPRRLLQAGLSLNQSELREPKKYARQAFSLNGYVPKDKFILIL
jgi:hypothetical protein